MSVWGVCRFPPGKPPLHTEAVEHFPTQIRIGDRLFFVSQIAPPDPETKLREAKPSETKPRTAPKARPGPKSLALPAELIAAAAEAEDSKPAPRIFIPPQVKENLLTESTLIQPASPPDLIPQVVPLPSFRVWTAQALRPPPPKSFVVPGRPKPPEPQQTAMLPPPDFDLVHADPVSSVTKATLTLPPTPPPLELKPPVPSASAIPPTPAGDPVRIISISDRPVAPKENLVVPPGNIVGRTGAGNGRGAVPSVAGGNSPLGNSPGGNDGDAGGNQRRRTGFKRGSPGSTAGSTAGKASERTVGSTLGRVITRSPTGAFDMVVTQSSNLDQFPEGKGLLTGRPIYSVYVSVESSKDWTLFFCVPGEKPVKSNPGTQVVDLSAAVPPIRAPYPTRMIRPNVSIPAYYKYVLVHGYITETGRVDRLRLVRPITAATDQAILAALAGWEFRSATKDGVQTAVEFLLSIPVNGL